MTIRYLVNLNKFDKSVNHYIDITKTFSTLKEALIYVRTIKKIKPWDSITITCEEYLKPF